MKIYKRYCAFLEHNYMLNIYLSEKCFQRKLWQQMKYEFYVYYNFPNVLMTFEIIKQKSRYAHVSMYIQQITTVFRTHLKITEVFYSR
jgi:hypothetical protein